MSKLPQLNLRINADFHPLVRTIAERLRMLDGDKFAYDLAAFLNDQPAPAAYAGDPELAGRVAELEAAVGKLTEMITALAMATPDGQVVTARPRKNDPFPEMVLFDADRLNREGMTWEDVAKTLKLRQTANGLRNAVKKWRQKLDQDWAKGAGA